MKTWITGAALAVLALPLACALDGVGDTGSTSERSYQTDAEGIRTLVVEQGDGELELVGRGGLDQVRVTLSTEEELADDALVTRREGDRLAVRQDRSLDDSSRLRIEVPSSLVAEVSDGGGVTRIEGLAGLVYSDASGTTDVRNIDGDVEIRDGSGTLTVSGVRGRVHVVSDGSGAIEVRSVDGDLVVDEDTSGPLDVEDVTGDVEVGHKTEDAIRVVRVGGDLTVRRHDAGRLDYDEVGGSVQVPGGDAG